MKHLKRSFSSGISKLHGLSGSTTDLTCTETENIPPDVGLPPRMSSFRLSGLRKKSKKKAEPFDDDNISITSNDFAPLKKKMREKHSDGDNLSINSQSSAMSERRMSLARVTSIANMVLDSPRKGVKRVGNVLQRSMSSRSLASLTPSKGGKFPPTSGPAGGAGGPGSARKQPQATPTRQRTTRLWSESVEVAPDLTPKQIKRQEAIYEVFQGEQDMCADLRLVQQVYHHGLKNLGLLSEGELDCLFCTMEGLLPLHEDLVQRLHAQRNQDGYTEFVGQVIDSWVPCLEQYAPYCANQVYAKDLLDAKKQEKRIEDFLERCYLSAFSRKLDLWSFLDVPRSRLVKYPLLLKNIISRTPADHEDVPLLRSAVLKVEEVIQRVDAQTGRAKCKFVISRLIYPYGDDDQKHPLIGECALVECEGLLKNSRGTKLHVFLFDKILVLTRSVKRAGRQYYQVHRRPLPVANMALHDIDENDAGKKDSFHNYFTSSGSHAGKYAFRVFFYDDPDTGYTLQASTEHDKKMWLKCLEAVIPPRKDPLPDPLSVGDVPDASLLSSSESSPGSSSAGGSSTMLVGAGNILGVSFEATADLSVSGASSTPEDSVCSGGAEGSDHLSRRRKRRHSAGRATRTPPMVNVPGLDPEGDAAAGIVRSPRKRACVTPTSAVVTTPSSASRRAAAAVTPRSSGRTPRTPAGSGSANGAAVASSRCSARLTPAAYSSPRTPAGSGSANGAAVASSRRSVRLTPAAYSPRASLASVESAGDDGSPALGDGSFARSAGRRRSVRLARRVSETTRCEEDNYAFF